jgi:hypothetical protein
VPWAEASFNALSLKVAIGKQISQVGHKDNKFNRLILKFRESVKPYRATYGWDIY